MTDGLTRLQTGRNSQTLLSTLALVKTLDPTWLCLLFQPAAAALRHWRQRCMAGMHASHAILEHASSSCARRLFNPYLSMARRDRPILFCALCANGAILSLNRTD